jgi:hypothetical protein
MLHRGADKALEYWRRLAALLRFGAEPRGASRCLDYATEKHFCKMLDAGLTFCFLVCVFF